IMTKTKRKTLSINANVSVDDIPSMFSHAVN
ncbi:unnamed protein product, partial [marine sediment metagenome]